MRSGPTPPRPTVRTYLERSYGKLGASNRSEAVARFLQRQR